MSSDNGSVAANLFWILSTLKGRTVSIALCLVTQYGLLSWYETASFFQCGLLGDYSFSFIFKLHHSAMFWELVLPRDRFLCATAPAQYRLPSGATPVPPRGGVAGAWGWLSLQLSSCNMSEDHDDEGTLAYGLLNSGWLSAVSSPLLF